MAGRIMPKLEMFLEKLGKVQEKLDKLEKQVKGVDGKLRELQGKGSRLKNVFKTGKSSKKLEDGMHCANREERKL